MKKTLLLSLLLLLSTQSWAEMRYVTDEFRVPLRKSPCGRCSILIGGVKSGATMTFLEETRPDGEREDWTKVKTVKGTVGWMQSQYLEKQQIAKVRLKTTEAKLAKLQQQHSQMQESLNSADQNSSSMATKVQTLSETNQALNEELSHIKQISSNAISLQNQNQELLKRNKLLQSDVDVLTASNQQLKSRDSQTWLLYGGFLVILGALMATLLPRIKKRKKFSEWG